MGRLLQRPHLAHFIDREDAGRQLADRLLARRFERPLVLALPRGGVPVGYGVALALDAPLDVLLVRKLGAPGMPELAIGAVVDGPQPQCILNQRVIDAVQPPAGYLEAEQQHQLEVLAQRKALLRRGRPALPLAGRDVIVVDDGIATGSTMRVALQAVEAEGAASVTMAVPVAPADVARSFGLPAQAVEVLLTPPDFRAVGDYYANFAQLTDAEVIALLDRAASRPPRMLVHGTPGAVEIDRAPPSV
jgi:putative phosphoribosyl transferase